MSTDNNNNPIEVAAIATTPSVVAGEIEVHRVLNPYNGPKSNPIRVWCDGCFDMMHWGHSNAIRQAKELGDILVVGVHSDAEIMRHKGPPVMNERERYLAVSACKWVDEIVENAPYVTHLDSLNRYNINFCVHGEDITTDEFGNDTYGAVKSAGRYKQIKRSEGVSTTEIVGRMMLMSKDHIKSTTTDNNNPLTDNTEYALPTTQSILQFSLNPNRLNGIQLLERHTAKQVVYIDGAFDLFHVGHIEALRTARSFGDYLIVGIHNDLIVNSLKGSALPVLNLHERVLSVLACRFVDEVVIGAPYIINEKMLQQLHIAIVVHGSCSDYSNSTVITNPDHPDPYQIPKQLNLYRQFHSKFTELTTSTIISRIIENRLLFEQRQQKKAKGLAEIQQSQKQVWANKALNAASTETNNNNNNQ